MSTGLRLSSYLFLLCVCFFVVFFLYVSNAKAQFTGSETSSRLALDPRYPEPGSTVKISLEVYSVDTNGSDIRWFVDGVELIEKRNDRSITVTAQELGEETTIEARIVPTQGIPMSIEGVVRPVVVDLIIESDTTVPSFYKGKALLSSSARGRAIAVVHTGDDAISANLSYQWKLNNQTLHGGALKGKNVIDFDTPEFDNNLLSVSVFGQNGTLIAEKTVRLALTEPELHFYEDNPLRGLGRRAIADNFTLVGEETSVRAEPYFISPASDSDTQFEWKVDGRDVTLTEDPQVITFRRSGEQGSSDVVLRIVNMKKLFQTITDSFNISFN